MDFIPETRILGVSKVRSTYRFRWVPNPLLAHDPLFDFVKEHVADEFAVPPGRAFLTYDDRWVDPKGNKFVNQTGTYSFPPSLLEAAVEDYLSGFPEDLTGVMSGPLTAQ